MPLLFRCAQGHLWEDLFEPSLVDGEVRCPQCGQASRPEAGTHPDVKEEPTPVELPAAVGATRLVPAPSSPPDGPMTAVNPALANMAPAARPADSEGELAPILPSRRHAERGSAQGAPPAPATPRRADWPDVPGYEIEAELGRGGMGVVYKARQARLNRAVALKMILSGSQADDRDRARFAREAQAVARLQHPNIVQIFEVGEHHGQAYFSLELVDGGSLGDRLKGQEVPVAEAARLIQVLAEAMHFAHQHGIVHRDLKPANILLTRGAADKTGALSSVGSRPQTPGSMPSLEARSAGLFGMPKITDFGLAKTLDDDTHNTRSGMVVGTPGYMAPEQATGAGVIGPATDIYALGVLLYQLVTARLPFTGDSPMDVLIKVTQQEAPPPSRYVPRLARDLETIILKCLEKAPPRRYASAADLAEDLRRFLAHEPILARPLAAWEQAARWARRRPATASLIAAVAVAVLGVGIALGAAARTEERRVGKMREELAAVVERARAQAAGGAWFDVQTLLAEPRGRIFEEPALADLDAEVESLARQADDQVAARGRFRAFQQATDDALFQASLATTGSTGPQWALTREKATRALALVGANAAAGPALDRVAFTDEEKADTRRGCYELLLYLAEAAAVPLPGDGRPPAAKAAEALAILDTAAGLGVQTHAYHLRRARYLEQAGRPDDAARERQLAARLPPATELDYYLVGSEYLREGQVEKAYDAFLAARRLKPDHFWVQYSLARLQVMRRELEAARDNLTSCLGRSQVVWIYLLRGLAQGQIKGAEAEAEADFQKALDMLKAQPDEGAEYALYNNRAITRLKRGRHDQALGDLRLAVARSPARHQAYLTLAQVHRERKDYPAAIDALTRGLEVAAAALARGEIDGGALYHLYRTRAQMQLAARGEGAEARALADLDAILRLPGLPAGLRAGALRDRGHQLFRSGRPRQALQAYDRALRLTPDDPALHRWRAEALLKQRRYGDAVAAYDRYLDLAARGKARPATKDLATVHRSRAVALLQLGQHHRALADYNMALAQSPGDAALWLQRGQTYLACKAWGLAVKDFSEALRLDASLAAAHQGLGTARLQLGQAAEAADDAARAARLAGKDARQVYSAACLLAQAAGQLGQRRPDAPAGRGARPENGPGKRHLDAALGLLGQAVEALPAGERKAFWRDVVRKEAALRPLWPLAGYAQLDRLHGS